MRNRLILVLILLALVAGVWFLRRKPAEPIASAYVGERDAVLWNTTAQVRERVAALHYGQHVSVLSHSGDLTQVRTDDNLDGWLDSKQLVDPGVWQASEELDTMAKTMPIQAVGHTRTISNVHIKPGRDTTRIFQFSRDVPLIVLRRESIPVGSTPDSKDAGSPDVASGKTSDSGKTEDWLLVLRAGANTVAAGSSATAGIPTATPVASAGGSAVAEDASLASTSVAGSGANGPIAGWVLAQFVDLDPPQPIPDYATASGLNVIAWAVLNTVPDPSAGDKPQYLVAASRGHEDQPCDFNALRVFTWGERDQRYETAYVENDLCGQLPIRVQQSSTGPEFSFAEADESGNLRLYRMQQTTVHLLSSSPSPKQQ